MGTYILSISAAAVLSAVICAVSPGAGREKIGRFVSFASALAVALTILSPLSGGISFDFNLNLKTDQKDEAGQDDTIKKIAAESLADSVANTMKSLYNAEKSKVKIIIDTDEAEDFKVSGIRVYAYDTEIDTSLASSYLTKLYNCTVKVYTE